MVRNCAEVEHTFEILLHGDEIILILHDENFREEMYNIRSIYTHQTIIQTAQE